MITQAMLSALFNVLLIGGLPFAFYFTYHKVRHKRSSVEILARAGLRFGDARGFGACVVLALILVAALALWPPPVEPFTREGSAQHAFVGLGFDGTSLTLALLYGIVKTGFPEELLFRGLIAGSLGRRGALVLGWVRVRSDSMIGSWFAHAAVNVTMCLSIAMRTTS